MSAETLRRAAALMRERAEAATQGPWANRPGSIDTGNAAVLGPARAAVALSYCNTDNAHIASWHPVVALAVADWLDEEAAAWDFNGWPQSDNALAVARAYLGEQP